MALTSDQRENIVFDFVFKNEVTEFEGDEDLKRVFGISFNRFPILENHVSLENITESQAEEILNKLVIEKHNLFSINDIEVIAKVLDAIIDLGETQTIEIIRETLSEFDDVIELNFSNSESVPVKKINQVIERRDVSNFISSYIENLKKVYRNSNSEKFFKFKQKRAERLPVFN